MLKIVFIPNYSLIIYQVNCITCCLGKKIKNVHVLCVCVIHFIAKNFRIDKKKSSTQFPADSMLLIIELLRAKLKSSLVNDKMYMEQMQKSFKTQNPSIMKGARVFAWNICSPCSLNAAKSLYLLSKNICLCFTIPSYLPEAHK